ncbi:MAG: ribosome-associated translation inhibitor RaiA [Salibacteraceae bacterium]
MKWDIQAVGFDAKAELLETVKSSVMKLEKFYTPLIGAEVYLRLDNQHTKENKKVEIKLNIPGEDLFAEYTSSSFEHSINECIDKLKRQIEKKKEAERSVR